MDGGAVLETDDLVLTPDPTESAAARGLGEAEPQVNSIEARYFANGSIPT